MAAVEEARFPESEVVRSVRYFTPRRKLEVRFTNGRVYLYYDVPQEEVAASGWRVPQAVISTSISATITASRG